MSVPPALGLMPVVRFSGPYAFLSNFYPSPLLYEDLLYPAAEHAFQAAKSTDWNERRNIAGTGSPAEAKRYGRQLRLRPDWDRMRRAVMLQIVLEKFVQNPALAAQLTATGDRVLVEGNTWGDDFWGAIQRDDKRRTQLPIWYAGDQVLAGRNWLGWSLMTVRYALAETR